MYVSMLDRWEAWPRLSLSGCPWHFGECCLAPDLSACVAAGAWGWPCSRGLPASGPHPPPMSGLKGGAQLSPAQAPAQGVSSCGGAFMHHCD